MNTSKKYNSKNFFKHTFCEFQQVDNFHFPENTNYKSKSESLYFYTDEGVYRKSNHWGRVANCRWKISTNDTYKNQKTIIGFAKWSDFHPINSTEKNFWIAVNFDDKTVKIHPKKKENQQHLFNYSEAQKRAKQINLLFKDDKWTNYFDLQKDQLIKEVISVFINSDKSLSTIKTSFKS
ncbi:hypothetical protein [Polaribacter sp. M15]